MPDIFGGPTVDDLAKLWESQNHTYTFDEREKEKMESVLLPVDGEMVYYTLGNEWNRPGEVRPAMVVRVWSTEVVNLLIFLDGDNDKFIGSDGWQTVPGHVLWKTSVPYAQQVPAASWHRADPILEPYEA